MATTLERRWRSVAAAAVVLLVVSVVTGVVRSRDGTAAEVLRPPPPRAAPDVPRETEPTEGGARGTTGFTAVPDLPLALDLALVATDGVLLDRDDDAPDHVAFRFAAPVQELLDTSGFYLRAPDGATVPARDARRSLEDPAVIVASFPADREASAFPLAGVRAGTVVDRQGRHNPPGTVVHRAVTVGSTAAPELVEAVVRSDVNWVHYRFTDRLSQDSLRPEGFGYHTVDGTLVRAGRIVSVDGYHVVVGFSSRDGERVDEAARIVATPDAVQGHHGLGSTLGVAPGPAGAGDTAAPDLVTAVRRSPTRVAYTFDRQVTDVDPAGFWARDRAGGRHAASSAALADGGRTVVAVFPEVEDLRHELALAAVRPDAARSSDRAAVPVTFGVVAWSSDRPTGPSLGPDLLDVDLADGTRFATFRFDETVDDDDDRDPDPGDFALLTSSGAVLRAEFVVDVAGATVTVGFPDAAADAVAALLPEAVVHGHDGLANPAALRVLP